VYEIIAGEVEQTIRNFLAEPDIQIQFHNQIGLLSYRSFLRRIK